MGNRRSNWSTWTEADTTRLTTLVDQRSGLNWTEIAERFPGRTPKSCAAHYRAAKLRARGIKRERWSPPPVNPDRVHRTTPLQQPRELPLPATITAYVLGDPLPGRSALDKRMMQQSA
jgi:Myb-like DNA-binding protein